MILVLVATGLSCLGSEPPPLVEPADAAVFHTPIPHFVWGQAFEPSPRAMPSYEIQIAADRDFKKVVDRDRLAAVIAWYVPDRELPPGDYWWRVRGVAPDGRAGHWSRRRSFRVTPGRRFNVPVGSDFERVRAIVARAAADPPAQVVFEEGVYRLDPGGPRALFDLADARDLVIDGGGSTVVLLRPAPVANFTRCHRVVLKGFVFDYDPLPYTAGRVVAVDAQSGAIEVVILPGHPFPDAFPPFSEDRKAMVVSPTEGYAMKRGAPLVVPNAGFERIEGRRFRFRLQNPRHAARLAPGDVYVLDPRWLGRAGGTCVRVCGGEDVVLYELTIRAAANECLNSYYANRHAILHVRLERLPGRALSVNNGGNNHHNARTGPWIEGCLFENTGDDICHVNGYAMGIERLEPPSRLIVRLGQPFDLFGPQAALDIRPGDRLQFFDRSKGLLLAERRVVAVRRQPNALAITLDRPVRGLKPGRLRRDPRISHAAPADPSTTQLFDASRACNQFVFRNNVCRHGRRVGVLAKGFGGLVEGNLFVGLGGGGVELWNAPYEGLGAENYVVTRNRIVACQRLARTHAAIWANAFASGGSPIHRNILIEGNVIRDCPAPAILLRDIENAVVRGNRLEAIRGNPREGITTNNAHELTIEGNAVH